jgi:signal transduction histidine kinase
MRTLFRARLLLLMGALVLVAGFALWEVQNSWGRITDLEKRLTTGHLDSFRLAGDFEARLHNLNNSMLRFAVTRRPEDWSQFEKASDRLNRWIDENDPRLNRNSKLSTADERRIFQQLNDLYDDYLRAAQSVRTNLQPALVSRDLFGQLGEFDNQSRGLVALGSQLAAAHRGAEGTFLTAANKSLGNLRALLSCSVLAMLGLVAVLGWVIYRDMIAPLRVKLVWSEQLLERQEKLATLGTLAAGIAHEIRNPLTSVKARLYTLGKHIKGNEAGLTDAGVISQEITRLERIVQEVLQFARPSDPHNIRVAADLPLREVQALMAGACEKSNVQLVLEAGPPLFVSIDPALIKQVLINLVRNAVEAIQGPGVVTLRLRADRALLHERACDVAILEVSDTGQGMPPEVEKRLFDPFFTTKESGTGLGLPIAARIVEKHGGALQYTTRPGRGTTFGIVLPLAPDTASAST